MRIGSLVLAALLVLSGCGIATKSIGVSATCQEFEGQAPPVVVDQGQIELAVGDTLTVSLCSNPSTGYAWSNDIAFDRSVVELTGRALQPGSASPPVVGAAGTEVFTFRALAPGTTTIEMTYGRSFEPGQLPAWTFRLPVLVG